MPSYSPPIFVVPAEQVLSGGSGIAVRRRLRHRDIPSHAHEFDECAFVEAGAGWHARGLEMRLLRAGDVIWIPRGQSHAYINGTGLTISNVYCTISHIFAENFGLSPRLARRRLAIQPESAP